MNILIGILAFVVLVTLLIFFYFWKEKDLIRAIISFIGFLVEAAVLSLFIDPIFSTVRETFIEAVAVEKTTENIIEEETTSENAIEENSSEVATEESTVSEKETEDEESETEEASTEDEFIFPDSDTRRLSRSELEGKNEWECKIARNEIFARRGKIFDDPELQEYFESCSWYEGKNSQYEYSEYVSEIEAYNVQLIREYEEEHGFNPELNVPE
mgnify:CR=1 FL=1